MNKVFAVILTYNRKDLLKRALDAVCSQTRPCDSVIIIDNASQDGTRQMLLESDYLSLKVYVLSENVGASGGFNAGFRLAYQDGADLIWVMDDDVIPEPDALQRLLEAEDFLNQNDVDHSFLLSTAFTENNAVTNTPDVSHLKNEIGYDNWPKLVEYGVIPVQRATFASILMRRSVLDRHGLPIASMFIWGEDTEYTLRISQDMPGYLVGRSRVQHLRQRSGSLCILSEENPDRFNLYRYHVRNSVFVARKYKPLKKVLGVIWSCIKLMFKLFLKGELAKLNVVFQGVCESIVFYPDEESASSSIETLGVGLLPLERFASLNIDSPDDGRYINSITGSFQHGYNVNNL